MNLPYDAHKREIENFVKEFVEIDEVIIPKDRYSYLLLTLLGLEDLEAMLLFT